MDASQYIYIYLVEAHCIGWQLSHNSTLTAIKERLISIVFKKKFKTFLIVFYLSRSRSFKSVHSNWLY